MARIGHTIPGLHHGVSQQSAEFRLDGQSELQENTLPSVVEGLLKRPPEQHVAKIQAGTLSGASIFEINDGAGEQFLCVVTNGDLKVYDLDGNEETVSFPNGKGYLDSTNYETVTVNGTTYVINKDKTVTPKTSGPTTGDDRWDDWSGQLTEVVAATDYKITIKYNDGTTTKTMSGEYTGTTATPSLHDVLSEIWLNLTNAITAAGLSTVLTVAYDSTLGVVNIFPALGGTVALIGGNSMSVTAGPGYAWKGAGKVVASVDALPTYGVVGRIVAIASEPQDGGIFYKFISTGALLTSGSGSGASSKIGGTTPTAGANQIASGYWKETEGWDLTDSVGSNKITLNMEAATLPLVLTRSAGAWTCARAVWAIRLAGDLFSNPWPSFVNQKILGGFFHKGRLGFYTKNAVVLSEVNEHLNFFRTSVASLLDSDPIDVEVGSRKQDSSSIRHVIPHNERLLIFTDESQYVLDGTPTLTPSSVEIKPRGGFPCRSSMAPLETGRTVLFADTRDSVTNLRELFFLPDGIGIDAPEITGQVPSYIKGSVDLQAISPAYQCAILHTDHADHKNTLWVHNWFWEGDTKLQSAWHKWTLALATDILAATFMDEYLYVVTQRSDGVFLGRFNLSSGAKDTYTDFDVYLDQRYMVTSGDMSYNAGADATTITLPYVYDSSTLRVFCRVNSATDTDETLPGGFTGDSTLALGQILAVASTPTATTITVAGDRTSANLFVGHVFTEKFRFGVQRVKTATSGGGQAPLLQERMIFSRWTWFVEKSGTFDIVVTPKLRTAVTYTDSAPGSRLGESFTFGEVSLRTGEVRRMITGKAESLTIELQSTSALPLRLKTAAWEAKLVTRGQQI